jgi:hypothetical protein
MAAIKEVWIDSITVTITQTGDVVAVRGQGRTYAADGAPVRMYGPGDLTENMTQGDLMVITQWLKRAKDAIQEAFEIPNSDLLPESPLPPPIPTGPPAPEPQSRARDVGPPGPYPGP